jgi:glycerophosphoryl diester phosphodiesterase
MKVIAYLLAIAMSVPAAATECVGHRGNSGEELENTYSALESAYALGVPNIEFDIHHTRDGIAVLSHDEDLRRVAKDKPGRTCALRADISELSARTILDNCQMQNGDEVALLEEVLQRFSSRATRVLLELKDTPNERTLELVRDHYAAKPDAIHVISKSVEALMTARAYLGTDYRYLHIHRSFRGLSFDFDGILKRKAEAGRMADLTTAEFLTGTYTINQADDMLAYRDAGLSYVISDYPRLCLQTLAQD